MNVDEIGGGSYMNADFLKEAPHAKLVTVSAVTVETIRSNGETQRKAVVWFVEATSGLALNRTNLGFFKSHWGPETDGWLGQQVVLHLVDDEYMKRPCKAVRVRLPKPKPARPAGGRGDVDMVPNGAGLAPAYLRPSPSNPSMLVADDEADIPF